MEERGENVTGEMTRIFEASQYRILTAIYTIPLKKFPVNQNNDCFDVTYLHTLTCGCGFWGGGAVPRGAGAGAGADAVKKNKEGAGTGACAVKKT